MRYLFVAILGLCLTTHSFPQARPKGVREDLAEAQEKGGYSMVDFWGGASVVSVRDRTSSEVNLKRAIDQMSSQSPDGRFLLVRSGGLHLKNLLTGELRLIDADGNCGPLCWSPDGDRFVFSTGKAVYIYDVAKTSVAGNLGKGEYPQWAPDGEWISFENRGRLWLVSPDGKTRKRLFKTGKIYSAILWSPDSRFLSYTQIGGSSGGFLFWGIRCIEPYRVWVYRVEDGAKDWVRNICKPGRTLPWVRNEELSPS